MAVSEKDIQDRLERWSSSKYAVLERQKAYGIETALRDGDEFSNVNSLWEGAMNDADTGEWVTDIDLRDYWKWDNPMGITSPDGYRWFRVMSREVREYPLMSQYLQLPSLADFSGGIKFASVGGDLQGLLQLCLDGDAEALYAHSRKFDFGSGPNEVEVDITTLLPDDYDTSRNRYALNVNRDTAEFFINGDIACVIVSAGRMGGWTLSPPPYGIGMAPHDMIKKGRTRISIDTSERLTLAQRPDVYSRSGDPLPSRTYRLYDYQADTLMTEGTYDTGTSYKSHPVPTAARSGKAFLFQADTDSVSDGLGVEVLTEEGNWRTYLTRTYSANTLESIEPTGEFPLMRLAYEPAADGASITDAEATVR